MNAGREYLGALFEFAVFRLLEGWDEPQQIDVIWARSATEAIHLARHRLNRAPLVVNRGAVVDY